MTVDPSAPTAGESRRVVVDAQIVLAMFLVRRDRPAESPTKRLLLRMLSLPAFHWLWTPDILADYERGALAIEQDSRIMRRAVFDRTEFQLWRAALQLHPPVSVSVTALREVRRQISQAVHARQRDLDDAIHIPGLCSGWWRTGADFE